MDNENKKVTVLRLEFGIPDYCFGIDRYIKLTDNFTLTARLIDFETDEYWTPGKKELFYQEENNSFLYMATKDPKETYAGAIANGVSDAYGKLRGIVDKLPKLGLALIERYEKLTSSGKETLSPYEPFGVDSGEEYYKEIQADNDRTADQTTDARGD